MAPKYVGPAASSPNDIITLSDLTNLKATTIGVVNVVAGDEPRPDGFLLVFWLGGTERPANMLDSDIQFMEVAPPAEIPPSISTTALMTLVQGSAFTQTLAATGNSPITWSVITGPLPVGLTLNGSTGTISGTPSASGAYNFTVEATNAFGTDTQSFTGTVSATGSAPVITTTTLNSMTVGSAFSQTPAATGSSPITWGITSGSIPGIGINSSSGLLSGTPTTAGSYTIVVEATNAFGSDTQSYSITVAAASADVEVPFHRYGLPGVLTTHSDAEAGAWLGHMYYVPDGLNVSGVTITKARLYVPAGSSIIGLTTARASLLRGLGTSLPGIGIENSDFEAGNIATFPTLTVGFNYATFAAPIQIYDNAAIALAYEMDQNYLYSFTLNGGPTPSNHGEGDRFGVYMVGSDEGVIPGMMRSIYDGGPSVSAWYGLDPVFNVPPALLDAGGAAGRPVVKPWVGRSPFRAGGVPGTATQTVAFKPATAGNKLMLCVAASATITTPAGWTLLQNAVADSGLYVFTKTASGGESSVSVTTSANDYTALGVVYEFASTTTIGPSSKADSTPISGTQLNPALTGMTGTNYIFAVRAIPSGSWGGFGGVSWDSGIFADVQLASYPDAHPSVTTGSLGFITAIQEGVTDPTWQRGGANRVGPGPATFQSISVAVKL